MNTDGIENNQSVAAQSNKKTYVRKPKEKLVSSKCSIRFDGDKRLWAILDKSNQPVSHFSYGIMRNVTFSTEERREAVGCGPSTTTHIGIATGDLVINTYGKDATGYQNFKFDGQNFLNASGEVLKEAKVLRLFSNRASLIK